MNLIFYGTISAFFAGSYITLYFALVFIIMKSIFTPNMTKTSSLIKLLTWIQFKDNVTNLNLLMTHDMLLCPVKCYG